MFYRADEAHSNIVGSRGLEQIDLEFDPSWLRLHFEKGWSPVVNWDGGTAGLQAKKLAKLWSNPASCEKVLRQATRAFLVQNIHGTTARKPPWLDAALLLMDTPHITASRIAEHLNMHGGWFAEAYRSAMGEGVGETLRRRRVEQARHMLMNSSEPQAQVAAAAGFCDQSHMIRAFRAVLGRTPDAVRRQQFDSQGG
jgi:AraC-like DNA-binding protein